MTAIVYKEFLKFKFAYLFFVFLIFAFIIWFFVDLRVMQATNLKKDIVLQVLYMRNISFLNIDTLNLLLSFSVAAVSFLKERAQARLRISLHLPCNRAALLAILTLTPILFISFIFVVEISLFFLFFKSFFPTEMTALLLNFLFYNACFCLAIFPSICAIFIDVNLKRAIFNIAVLLIFLYVYFIINPDIRFAKAYYLNENLGVYIFFVSIYSILTLIFAFAGYKKGYIK